MDFVQFHEVQILIAYLSGIQNIYCLYVQTQSAGCNLKINIHFCGIHAIILPFWDLHCSPNLGQNWDIRGVIYPETRFYMVCGS